jgi:hypothetical protein
VRDYEKSKRLAAIQFVTDVLTDAGVDLGNIDTLQELIDIAPDHNQMMLDAIAAVDEGLHVQVLGGLYVDPSSDTGLRASSSHAFDALNEIFAEVRKVLMEEA